jgi:hypothetical protein
MSSPGHAKIESLTITATGPATKNGRISLSELARIATGFQATLERLAYSIFIGRQRPGRFPREIADAVRMDFIGFRAGSAVLDLKRPSADVLGVDYLDSADDLLSDSFGVLVDGLERLRQNPLDLPEHFTSNVVNGLVTLCGGISNRNVSSIRFSTSGHEYFVLDAAMRRSLQRAQKNTSQQELTIVGRLHMGDFDPLSLRCRIDTHSGSVSCDLDDELREAVLDLLDSLVIAQGVAEMQPDGDAVRVLHLESIEGVETAAAWSLDELAQQQGIGPLGDVEKLRGEPIDDFDSFLETLRSAR